MEEVDGLILSALSNIGCEFGESVVKLKQFSHSQTFEAISRSILHVKPDAPIKSVNLPPNMGDRFRTGTLLADIIKRLGYRDDLGYQTILYGNEVEIRRLLIFLIELFPKTADLHDSDQPTSTAFDQLCKLAGQNLKNHFLDPVWIPEFCKRYDFKWDGRYWTPPLINFSTRLFRSRDFLSSPKKSIIDDQCSADQSESTSSIIAYNSKLRYNLKPEEPFHFEELPAFDHQKLIKPALPPRKPKLPPKPIFSAPVQEKQREQLETNVETVPEKIDNYKKEEEEQANVLELRNLESEILLLNSDIQKLQLDILENDKQSDNIMAEIQSRTEEFKRNEEENKKNRRFTDLLPNMNENIRKLQEFLNNSESRSSNLTAQWLTHKSSLDAQLLKLRAERSHVTAYERLREDIVEAARKIDQFDAEIVEKRILIDKLKNECQKLEAKTSRTFYTQRILDIIASIRKQKEETNKILIDIKSAQKDINMLNGKLDRTFRAADEIMFNDAKKDETVKRAYKIMVNLHEMCAEILTDFETMGQYSREIRDLEDKIELENQNGIDKKLETLVTDYCVVKEENEKLMKKLNVQA